MIKLLTTAFALVAILSAPSFDRSVSAAPTEVTVSGKVIGQYAVQAERRTNMVQFCLPEENFEMHRFYCRLSGG